MPKSTQQAQPSRAAVDQITSELSTSLNYRKKRIASLHSEWNGTLFSDLILGFEISNDLKKEFNFSIKKFISASMHFDFATDDDEFVKILDKNRNNRLNVTPNGAVVPKSEHCIEYNKFLKVWCDIVRECIKPNPQMLSRFRLTPNIRIKFGTELEENIGRSLNTALPHSDAWVEGPWGMNCHVPLLGDTESNYLSFYQLVDEAAFKDEFLELAEKYTSMQWVLDYYTEMKTFIPPKNHVVISDYALLHKTNRLPEAGTRVSIDTTIFVGDHSVHPDRAMEYLDQIPKIGDDMFVKCLRSENDDIENKPSVFSHYTSGGLQRVKI